MMIDNALQFMVMDILKEILSMSDNPNGLATYITRQMRELIACKMVILIGHDHDHNENQHEILGLCPERNISSLNKSLLFRLAELSHEMDSTTLLKHKGEHEIHQILQTYGGESSVIIPLKYGNKHAGVIIMIDIANKHNINSTIDSLDSLAGVLALELRNASLYMKIEEKVKSRTQQLMESEMSFQEIFNSTTEAIFIYDALTGIIINSNHRAVEMYGYQSKDELIKQNPKITRSSTEPYTLDKALQKFALAIKGEPQTFEWLTLKKNGEKFWIEVSLKSSKIGGKETVIAVVRDISDRKVADEKLHSMNQELIALNEELATQNEEYLVLNEELLKNMKQINLMYKELEIAKHKAEESDRLKSAFLANMSHEIRTPLNSIMGFASLLPDEHNKELVEQYANIIVQNSEQLVHIIDDIVLFSNLQAKKYRTNISEFDLNVLLKELLQSFSLPEYLQNINLKLESDIACPYLVKSDYEKIRQILTNLMANAFKYTSKGNITIGAKIQNDQLIVYVLDTGIGIPASETNKIFDRFFRGSNTRKETVPGTGLGLSIVKELVEVIGGEIWVESEEGKGSNFYFSINSKKEL